MSGQMNQPFFSASEITEFPKNSWQMIVFKEMEAVLSSDSKPFPCLFGVAGLKAGQLRFAFLDKIVPEQLSQVLNAYLIEARNFGKNTSLIVFEKPSKALDIEEYEHKFWNLMRDVKRYDSVPWPEYIPETIDHQDWEFCFKGEPIFVVCNTPAHIFRQSRRSSTFNLTFQPRWVFEEILATEKLANNAFSAVSKRLEPFDLLGKSPDLGRYGDVSNREYKQYFLRDTNEVSKCPFSSLNVG